MSGKSNNEFFCGDEDKGFMSINEVVFFGPKELEYVRQAIRNKAEKKETQLLAQLKSKRGEDSDLQKKTS